MEVQPPDRPEVFEIFMQPGTGESELAEDLVADLGPDQVVPGSAVHVASVQTPTGLSHLVTLKSGGLNCVATVTDSGGGSSCGATATPGDLADGSGWGSDGMWNETQIFGPDGTVEIVATARDGTTYTIHTHERWGILVWAAIHGEITDWVAFDADGNEIP